jgi:hypothetical protein
MKKALAAHATSAIFFGPERPRQTKWNETRQNPTNPLRKHAGAASSVQRKRTPA